MKKLRFQDIVAMSQKNEAEDMRAMFGCFTMLGSITKQNHVYYTPQRVEGGAICVCLEGECEISIDMKCYNLKKGHLCVVFPNAVFQAISKSESFTGYFMAAETEKIRMLEIPSATSLYLLMRDNPCVPLSENEQEQLLSICRLLSEKINRGGGSYYSNEITDCFLKIIAYEIASIYQKNKPISKSIQSRNESMFHKFLYLVALHYKEERKLDFYAGLLCLTPKYLSSLIRSISGVRATEWIIYYVILNAKIMLETSEMTIQQISDVLNFPNSSFFSQYFKKHTGVTPKAYKYKLPLGN